MPDQPLKKVLIVDDEPDIRELMIITLSRMGVEADEAESVRTAVKQLQRNQYQFCLTDLRMPDGDGIEVVEWIQQNLPAMPVAVFTAHGNMDTAITAMKAGAFDFLSKPVDLERLRSLVNTAIEIAKRPVSKRSKNSPPLLGNSPGIEKLKKQIKKVSRSLAPVFICGESGTGKELAARAIHYEGVRSEAPFVPVNCGAIPKELMESEFFGHKKGSFTGATSDKQGLFQAANGGTLFLDEVADLPLDMQVKLLRALQEKAIRPVGSDSEVSVDVRILSATHKDLQNEIEKERFRSDLFYRINVIQLSIPPLRERQEDIELLADHFLDRFSQSLDLPKAALNASALKKLKDYTFPGNIRELENILERAYTLCDEDVISAEDLQLMGESSPNVVNGQKADSNGYQQYDSIDDFLEEIEKDTILNALEKSKWNRTAAAKHLGISFRSFRYRLKKLGLDDSE